VASAAADGPQLPEDVDGTAVGDSESDSDGPLGQALDEAKDTREAAARAETAAAAAMGAAVGVFDDDTDADDSDDDGGGSGARDGDGGTAHQPSRPPRRRGFLRERRAEDAAFVPEGEAGRVDEDVLRSLPSGMQQEYIGAIRRQQQVDARSRMLPAAGDPRSFSRVQLSSFLQGAKLNLAVDRLNAEQAAALTGGERIAGDAGRQFLLQRADGTAVRMTGVHARAALLGSMGGRAADAAEARREADDGGSGRDGAGSASAGDDDRPTAAGGRATRAGGERGSAAGASAGGGQGPGGDPAAALATALRAAEAARVLRSGTLASLAGSGLADDEDEDDAFEDDGMGEAVRALGMRDAARASLGMRDAERASLAERVHQRVSVVRETEQYRGRICDGRSADGGEASGDARGAAGAWSTEDGAAPATLEASWGDAGGGDDEGWEDAKDDASAAPETADAGWEDAKDDASAAPETADAEWEDADGGVEGGPLSLGSGLDEEAMGAFLAEMGSATADAGAYDDASQREAERTMTASVAEARGDSAEAGDTGGPAGGALVTGGTLEAAAPTTAAERTPPKGESASVLTSSGCSAHGGGAAAAAPLPAPLAAPAAPPEDVSVPTSPRPGGSVDHDDTPSDGDDDSNGPSRLDTRQETSAAATADALAAAADTASQLTSWAGAAVRRILRRHDPSMAERLRQGARTVPTVQPRSSAVATGVVESATSATEAATSSAAEPAAGSRHPDSEAEPPASEGTQPSDEPTSEQPVTSAGSSSSFSASSVSAALAAEATDAGMTLEQLEREEDELQAKARRSQRDSEGVSETMQAEVMEVLDLWGVPYIVAPMEAEAQCAELERLGLAAGVVTDDSDAFLFGSRRVYKNIFESAKYVEAYHMEDVEREVGLARDDLVRAALLLGSDYTDGVKGVGIVNTVEILRAFPGDDGLREFKAWVEGVDGAAEEARLARDAKKRPELLDSLGPGERFKLTHQGARRRWVLGTTFPNRLVLDAYRRPNVSHADGRFEWKAPDFEGLARFAVDRLGFTEHQASSTLVPVAQELKQRRVQKGIRGFLMRYDDGHRAGMVRSKRLRSAVEGLAGTDAAAALAGDGTDGTDAPEAIGGKPKRKRAKRSKAKE